MCAAWRLLLGALVCCIAGALGWMTAAVAEGANAPVGGSGPAVGHGAPSDSSPLGSALVVSGAATEGQQLQAAEEARRRSPEAVRGRRLADPSSRI